MRPVGRAVSRNQASGNKETWWRLSQEGGESGRGKQKKLAEEERGASRAEGLELVSRHCSGGGDVCPIGQCGMYAPPTTFAPLGSLGLFGAKQRGPCTSPLAHDGSEQGCLTALSVMTEISVLAPSDMWPLSV